jgi:hypothetical protein
MTKDVHKITAVEATTRYTPGHLLAPFGWAADALGAMVEAEPTLLFHLFELDRTRMHLIALALAHLNEFSPDLGIFLVSGSVRAITEKILGRYPTGLKRAVGHLPWSVLAPENYRRLVELLADPEAAKLLHHAQSIDNSTIKTLHGLPDPLRNPFILEALECHDGASGFLDGLRLLVSRGASSSFDTLVCDLASASRLGLRTLLVRLKNLVEGLSLPINLPPMRVGKAIRLDQAVSIRSLAKSWHNCLANYVEDIDAGKCAVYIWKDSSAPAVCLVQRHGRLGWFLDQVKGPRNADIEPKRLAEIRSTFSAIGIPPDRDIAAIVGLIRDVETDERIEHIEIHESIGRVEIDERELRLIEREQRATERFLTNLDYLELVEA